MKTVWGHLSFFFKEHRWRYVLILCLMIASSIAMVVPARVIGQVVDAIVGGQLTRASLMRYIGVFLLALVVSFSAEAAWTYYIFKGSYQIQKIFRVKMMKQLLLKRMPFYTQFRTGDLVTRASEDVRVLGMTTGYGFYGTFNSVMGLTVLLITMVTTVSWKLAIVSLLPMPLLAWIILRLGEKEIEVFDASQDAVSQMNNDVLEIIDGTYVVRAFCQEERMTHLFKEKTQDALKKNMITALVETSFIQVCGMMMALCIVVGLMYGAYLVSLGEVRVGDIVSFQVYIGMMIWPVFQVGDMILVFQQGKVSLKRILEVMQYSDGLEPEGNAVLSHFEEIAFEDFSFTYPMEKEATLRSVSVTIRKGQTVGIVGMTGSGKTTFLKQWLHQYPYHHEKVTLNGQPIPYWTRESLTKMMAYVPQEHTLFSRTIRENLYFGSGIVDDDVLWQALEKASMADDVKRMPQQLDTLIGEKGVSLSGGQKQRLSIARALLKNAEVLLLDDALSAVDAKTEKEIIAHLKHERSQATNLITAHRLSAIKHADLILVFDKGEISDCGTHEELVSHRGWYYEQYVKQELEEVESDADNSVVNELFTV